MHTTAELKVLIGKVRARREKAYRNLFRVFNQLVKLDKELKRLDNKLPLARRLDRDAKARYSPMTTAPG